MRVRDIITETKDLKVDPNIKINPNKLGSEKEELIKKYGVPVTGRSDYYSTLLPAANILGSNIVKPTENMIGKRVYHATNKLEKIKQASGLRPRKDSTGEREYGRVTAYFRPAIGIFVSLSPNQWFGKYELSFVIEPGDKVYETYGGAFLIANPVAWDRLEISKNN